VPNKQADHYRALAERVLADAQKAKDAEAKSALLEIARRYDWLAQWAERSARTGKNR
jgi:hypothetical protein